MLRVALGVAALLVIFYPPFIARPLERQIALMGTLFEDGFAQTGTKEKIRLIVLVTMVSLLLELVMIRWLASVFPVFAFFKNFTLLACFLGLGAGYAVSDRQRCAPAMVLPMLALFVGIITLLRYDIGAVSDVFSGLPMSEQTAIHIWMDKLNLLAMFQQSVPLYLLLGMSFVLCACICYPVGQLCGKLLQATELAEGVRPQPGRQHSRRRCAVRDEPVLAAADHLVHGGRRRAAVLRAARRTTAWRSASPASACC